MISDTLRLACSKSLQAVEVSRSLYPSDQLHKSLVKLSSVAVLDADRYVHSDRALCTYTGLTLKNARKVQSVHRLPDEALPFHVPCSILLLDLPHTCRTWAATFPAICRGFSSISSKSDCHAAVRQRHKVVRLRKPEVLNGCQIPSFAFSGSVSASSSAP